MISSSGAQPSPNAVILGRGKGLTEHPGNKRLRALAMMHLDEYSNAGDKDRTMKTRILTRVVLMIRNSCPDGEGFVRRNHYGMWQSVDNSSAREKVGYVFRDLLADKYRSSSKSRVARRRQKEKPNVTVDPFTDWIQKTLP